MSENNQNNPTRNNPYWTGTTLPMPGRINGEQVVAGIKLPTTKDEVAHQWACVTVSQNQEFSYARIAHTADGFKRTHSEPAEGYPAALGRMLQQANSLFTPEKQVDLPESAQV